MHCRVHRDSPPGTGGRQLPELRLSSCVQHEGQAVGNQHSHEACHCCLLLLREQVCGHRANLTVKGCHQERQHLLQACHYVFISHAKGSRTEAADAWHAQCCNDAVHTLCSQGSKQSAGTPLLLLLLPPSGRPEAQPPSATPGAGSALQCAAWQQQRLPVATAAAACTAQNPSHNVPKSDHGASHPLFVPSHDMALYTHVPIAKPGIKLKQQSRRLHLSQMLWGSADQCKMMFQ